MEGTRDGQDRVVVFVRHGGVLVRVHHSRLCKVNTQEQDKQTAQDVANRKAESEEGMTNNAVDSSDSDQDTDNEQENISGMEVNTGEVLHPPLTQTNVTQTDTEHRACGNPAPFAGVKLRTGQTVTFVSRDDGIQHTARILGRVGKATGKLKNVYNLQHLEPDGGEGQKESADMSRVGSLNIESEDREADVLITKDISFDAAKH